MELFRSLATRDFVLKTVNRENRIAESIMWMIVESK